MASNFSANHTNLFLPSAHSPLGVHGYAKRRAGPGSHMAPRAAGERGGNGERALARLPLPSSHRGGKATPRALRPPPPPSLGSQRLWTRPKETPGCLPSHGSMDETDARACARAVPCANIIWLLAVVCARTTRRCFAALLGSGVCCVLLLPSIRRSDQV